MNSSIKAFSRPITLIALLALFLFVTYWAYKDQERRFYRHSGSVYVSIILSSSSAKQVLSEDELQELLRSTIVYNALSMGVPKIQFVANDKDVPDQVFSVSIGIEETQERDIVISYAIKIKQFRGLYMPATRISTIPRAQVTRGRDELKNDILAIISKYSTDFSASMTEAMLHKAPIRY